MNDLWQELNDMCVTTNTNVTVPLGSLEALLDQHKTVCEERDALAAHVERLTSNIVVLIASNRIDGRDFHCIIKDTPQTSLAKLIAQKQAEALRSVRQRAMAAGGDVHLDVYLSDEIKRLHRQAERE